MKFGLGLTVLEAFNANWGSLRPEFLLAVSDGDANVAGHPLESELSALSQGCSASLPFFTSGSGDVVWCTMASTPNELRKAIADLHAWVLPSFGWEDHEGGFVSSQNATSPLAQQILIVSAAGYFRWRCRAVDFSVVLGKLYQQRQLDSSRPLRVRPYRPSLYELRSRFSTCLVVGDREGAEQAVTDIAQAQLDSALNILFMQIRLWHCFREFDRIANHPDLPRLRTQSLPDSVIVWINEAVRAETPTPPVDAGLTTSPSAIELPSALAATASNWKTWFDDLEAGREASAQMFLKERQLTALEDIQADQIRSLVDDLERIYLNDSLRHTHRTLLAQGLAEFLQDFVREPDFPRSDFGDLYLALLRLWGVLHSGSSVGPEAHVLLELGSATLRLNRGPNEVLQIVQEWWEERKVPSQLPFLLDAIELLDRDHPDRNAPTNLWLEAADLVRRSPDSLTPSERELWSRVGLRLGIDGKTIADYLPRAFQAEEDDFLAEAKIKHVAIVCMRERQAREAAEQIQQRTHARVSIVTNKVAGSDTDNARTADVVLFVWMATSHAVFRAFDRFDRNRLCFVQGTGASSILRSLERWLLFQSESSERSGISA
jgi:hypothetical protein